MSRAFDYAAAAAGCRGQGESQAACMAIAQLIDGWRREVKAAFLDGYRAGVGNCAVCPREPALADALIRLFVLKKALYDLRYELENRPQWLAIPRKGLMELTESTS